MLLGRDMNTGFINTNELKSNVPGQTYIDVDEVESKKETKKNSEDKKNIIDLQKNKA